MEFDAPPVHTPPPPTPPPPHAAPPYAAPYPVPQAVVPQPADAAPRARTVLISLGAGLAALVLIVATNNQSVTDWVVRKATGHPNSFRANLALASQAFRWRLSTNTTDSLAADYTRDAVLVVLTGLLVAAIARGAVTFGRAFWGAWMAVIVAAEVGAVASAFVVPGVKLPSGHSATQRLFLPNPYTAGPYVFIGALGLGLVVAAITGLIAITTRRPAQPAWVPVAPDGWPQPIDVAPPSQLPPEPPPWTPAPSYAEAPTWSSESAETAALPTEVLPPAAVPRWGEDETVVEDWSHETTALPKWDDAEAETTHLPRLEEEPRDSRVRIDDQDEGNDDEDDYPSPPPGER